MTARRDPDLLIQAFLDEGQTELPDRAYDAVRAEIDHTRQRAVFGPWRVLSMLNYARYGVAAAAIVAVAVLGIYFLPRLGSFGGPGATPTPSPLPPTTATLLSDSGALAPGAYYIDNPDFVPARRYTFTVPAGWTADGDIVKDRNQPTEVMLATWAVDRVYADVCQWRGTQVDAGTTVDELVSALAAQNGRTTSVPTDTTVSGFAAKRIDLITPDQEAAFCQGGRFHYWPEDYPDEDVSGLWSSRGNHTDVVYVLDVAGSRVAIVARHHAGSSTQDVAELEAIVASIRIEP